MKKFQYIVVLLFVIVLGTGCSNDEKQENFLSETENEIENKEDGVIYEVYTCLLYTSPSPRDTR
mgnify:CR=1 FL=1